MSAESTTIQSKASMPAYGGIRNWTGPRTLAHDPTKGAEWNDLQFCRYFVEKTYSVALKIFFFTMNKPLKEVEDNQGGEEEAS